VSGTVQVILVIFASAILAQLITIGGQIREVVGELQRLRNAFIQPPGMDEERRETWDSWPHMIARLLEETQGDVRDFRRKMIGREPYDR
jgi:hypothetical protein